MKPNSRIFTLVYGVVLLGCAFFAGFDWFGYAFGLGEAGTTPGLTDEILLKGTLAGGAGLVIAAWLSWNRWRAVNLVALVCALAVLPLAAILGWWGLRANWLNTQIGMHFPWWDWASVILPTPLDLVALGMSWIRLRNWPTSERQKAQP